LARAACLWLHAWPQIGRKPLLGPAESRVRLPAFASQCPTASMRPTSPFVHWSEFCVGFFASKTVGRFFTRPISSPIPARLCRFCILAPCRRLTEPIPASGACLRSTESICLLGCRDHRGTHRGLVPGWRWRSRQQCLIVRGAAGGPSSAGSRNGARRCKFEL